MICFPALINLSGFILSSFEYVFAEVILILLFESFIVNSLLYFSSSSLSPFAIFVISPIFSRPKIATINCSFVELTLSPLLLIDFTASIAFIKFPILWSLNFSDNLCFVIVIIFY